MLNWEFCGTLDKVSRLEDSLLPVSNINLQVRPIIIKYNLIKIQKILRLNKKKIIAKVTLIDMWLLV